MKYVHLISGGAGSWLAAKLMIERHPDATHFFSFTDVLYEDADCYRFLLEGLCSLLGVDASWVPSADDFPDYRVDAATPIEEYAGNPKWRKFLRELRDLAAVKLPYLAWLVEGRDPWEVFRDRRFLGNSGVDPCSLVLKREMRDKWLAAHFTPSDTTLVIGIGPDERHRYEGDKQRAGFGPMMAKRGWGTAAPLIDAVEGQIGPFVYLAKAGIARPRLYPLGYVHNNCGGYCCKAGQGHYQNRFEQQPERYDYDATMERKIIVYLGKPVSMLTDRAGDGKKKQLTLDELRRRMIAQPAVKIPLLAGESGCGCMLT